jgi:lipoprotein-anchoring transpeptidase ErfK/SrfK
MAHTRNSIHQPRSGRRIGACHAAIVLSALSLAPFLSASPARAQTLSYAPPSHVAFPSDDAEITAGEPTSTDTGTLRDLLPDRLRRTVVALDTAEPAGTIIIDTGNTALYYVLGSGRAIRYGVGVGRDGFTWSGVQSITQKTEWPDWHPPAKMIARQPYLPRFMAGGPGNPLGARAMYLGSSEYRIHGTNDPTTIGKFVSSGCIRLTNDDVIDLFNRVAIGAKVVVLAKNAAHLAARPVAAGESGPAGHSRPAVIRLTSGRQAMNLSTLPPY